MIPEEIEITHQTNYVPAGNAISSTALANPTVDSSSSEENIHDLCYPTDNLKHDPTDDECESIGNIPEIKNTLPNNYPVTHEFLIDEQVFIEHLTESGKTTGVVDISHTIPTILANLQAYGLLKDNQMMNSDDCVPHLGEGNEKEEPLIANSDLHKSNISTENMLGVETTMDAETNLFSPYISDNDISYLKLLDFCLQKGCELGFLDEFLNVMRKEIEQNCFNPRSYKLHKRETVLANVKKIQMSATCQNLIYYTVQRCEFTTSHNQYHHLRFFRFTYKPSKIKGLLRPE